MRATENTAPSPDFVTYRKVQEQRMVEVNGENIYPIMRWLNETWDKGLVLSADTSGKPYLLRLARGEPTSFAVLGDLIDNSGRVYDRYSKTQWSVEDADAPHR